MWKIKDSSFPPSPSPYLSFFSPSHCPPSEVQVLDSFSFMNHSQEICPPSCSTNPTLVEVGQGFFMQFHSRWCGCAKDVLKRRQFGFILRRQLRFFLLEDRQCKDISETYNSHTFSYKDFMEYSTLNLDLILMLSNNGDDLWRNAELWWLKKKEFGLQNVTRQLLPLGCQHWTQKNTALAKQYFWKLKCFKNIS